MIKNGWKFPVIVGLAVALTGCAANNQQGADTDNGMQQQGLNNRTGVGSQGWDNARNNNFRALHNNTRMEISDMIADTLTNMDEVDTATVLLTDENAYVAVVLDNGTGYGTSDMGRNVGKGRTYQADLGANNGTPNAMGRNATTDRMGRQGPGEGDQGLTQDLKSRIANKVRSVQPGVQNVYVSANADFVGRMRGYGDRFQNGQPLRGMIIEFNEMVDRIFPDAE